MFFWSLLMAFSLYSRVPIPGMERAPWEGAKKDYVLCFFPVVGLVIGAAEAVLFALCDAMALPATATACFLAALPVLLTGGIHVDGLIDAADARHSFLPKEERLRIMKDPHVGAFGVIRLALWLLLLVGALTVSLTDAAGTALSSAPGIILLFAVSRAVVGFSAQVLPPAKEEGMLNAVLGGERSRRRAAWILFLEIAALFAALFAWRAACALPLLIVFFLLFLYYRSMALRMFGGVSGDLAGWFLCVLELAGAFVYAAAPFFMRALA